MFPRLDEAACGLARRLHDEALGDAGFRGEAAEQNWTRLAFSVLGQGEQIRAVAR